jgi:hypothetical protein
MAGCLRPPVANGSIPVGMAERVEVVLDFAAYPIGSQLVLQNAAGAGGFAEIMRFDVVRDAPDSSQVPGAPSLIQPLREAQAVRTPTFTFEETQLADGPVYGWTVNGQTFDPQRVDALPDLNDIEVWTFRNVPFPGVPFQVIHPIHVHRGGLPNPGPRRTTARGLGGRLEGYGRGSSERTGAGDHAFGRLPWQVPHPLPQPRARGPRDDGALRRGVRCHHRSHVRLTMLWFVPSPGV